MINNKKVYSKLLLLIIVVLAILGTQSLAATVSRVTGLKSEPVNSTEVKLSWNRITNVTGYEVYIKEAGQYYKSIGKTNMNNNVRINNLTAGKTYYVKVRAYKGNMIGDFSSELRIVTNNNSSTTTLGKVTNLRQTSITTNTANIAWNSVTGATGYEVYVKEQYGSYSSKGTTTNLYATLNGLTPGKTYYVKVRAYNANKVGDFSSELRIVTNNNSSTTTLGKVTNLRQTSITTNTANIAWNSVTGATGYEVYVKEQSGAYINKGTTRNLYATIRGLTEGTTYDVKVRAYRLENGRTTYGDFSNELRFVTIKQPTTPSITLDKVMNLKASLTGTRADLTWNSVANVDGYEIYIDIPGKGYISLGTVTKNNVGIIGLQLGQTYNIKVRAYKGTTYGEFSDEIKITTQNEEKIGKVENLQSVVTGTETRLTWNAVEKAAQYEVFINIPGRGYISLGTTRTNTVRVISLSKGVTYQIKVRAIGTVNGSTVYGDYSNEVTVLAK
jgi:CRISPR/Cas system CMR-associated protein Cmr5 small subunit